MMRGRLMHQWDQTATIWQVVAETNRDSEKRPEPFSVFDIHPYRSQEDVQPESTPSGFWARVNRARVFDEHGQQAVLQSLFHGG